MDEDLLREAVCESLSDQTDAGTRVYDSRIITIADAELPLLNVFTPTDIGQFPSLITSLEVYAFLAAAEGESIGAKCSTIRKQIRAALKALWDEAGLVAVYVGRETQFELEAAKPHAVIKLTYNVESLDTE